MNSNEARRVVFSVQLDVGRELSRGYGEKGRGEKGQEKVASRRKSGAVRDPGIRRTRIAER